MRDKLGFRKVRSLKRVSNVRKLTVKDKLDLGKLGSAKKESSRKTPTVRDNCNLREIDFIKCINVRKEFCSLNVK